MNTTATPIRASEVNINSREYWDQVYRKETDEGRVRVDAYRMSNLLRWMLQLRRDYRDKDVTMLDVGCGTAEVFRACRGWADWLKGAGVDISQDAVDYCRSMLPGNRFQFEAVDLNEGALPFNDGQFDLVWCGETLEHLTDTDAALAEMLRVLRDQGYLALSVPYRGRNRSNEHQWEFCPADVVRWAERAGELVYLDACVLQWLCIFAVIRKGREFS